jgi:hypothetical protein
VAGSLTKEGYNVIKVDGRLYKSHRLAWFYVYGEFPVKCINHINGVKMIIVSKILEK